MLSARGGGMCEPSHPPPPPGVQGLQVSRLEGIADPLVIKPLHCEPPHCITALRLDIWEKCPGGIWIHQTHIPAPGNIFSPKLLVFLLPSS